MSNNLKGLDANQVLRSVYDDAKNTLRVSIVDGSSGGGSFEVIINHVDDSVRLGDGTNFLTSTTIGPKVALDTNIINTIDIEDIDATKDNIAIRDSAGDELGINPDGSIEAIVQGKSLFLSGLANANNVNIIAPVEVAGYDTVIIHTTGTFNVSAAAQFSNDNVNWVSVLGQTLIAAGTAPTTNLNTTNTIYKVPVSGRYFRYRTTAYTSGTIVANVYISAHDINDLGTRNNTISGTVTTTGTITAGNVQVTGTGAALNATPIASTAVPQYDVATVALTGTWVATVVAEGSNDGAIWFIIPVQMINSLTSLPQDTITTNGLYKIPLQFNNLRLRVSSYTSGTVSANARISAIDSDSLLPRLTVESGTTRNIYGEVLSVPSNSLTNIVTFTATQTSRLKQVDVSGENIAVYEVLVNGTSVSKKRTALGSQLDCNFFFDKGITFTSGQQIVVRVIHNRPTTGNFNANIIVLEG